ncbi:cell cycle progression protein 1 isoform X2 [Mugil cephalus]|uniref:cell cycle progression protein 1 isoform X2 n=1 Tax=Mugil cephalus TaxID=48193 RepID=UPI001FB62743|nr:cell cycle progression protein 1 isoform X2 [Mugil cephalus]
MSETSSDAESSCGWTIISNEGSDIETLGSEAAVEYEAELLERPPEEDKDLHDAQASTSAVCVEEKSVDSLDNTLGEQTLVETLDTSEVANLPVSFSDHSDIVTLGDLKDDDHAEVAEEAAANEFYLGTSSSSQYAFIAAETGLLLSYWKLPQSLVNLSHHLRSQLTGVRSFPALSVQQTAVTHSSSSEDEAGPSSGTVIRRRRLRKNTTGSITNVVTDPEDEVVLESHPSDEEKDEKPREKEQQQQHEEAEEETEVRPAAMDGRMKGQASSILNRCILLTLVIAISMAFGHFYGTAQIQERLKSVENIRGNELDSVRDLLHKNQDLSDDFGLDDVDEQKVISLLTEVIEKMRKENQELNMRQVYIQAQRDDLEVLLKQKSEEKTNTESEQQRLTAENQLLKSSLEREEKSLSALQQELSNLRSKIRDLEAMGSGADSLLSENQRLKEQLEEEKQLIRNFQGQREDMMVEAQMLRNKLDKERKVTDELRRELNRLRSQEASPEAEELQSRLMNLEKRLSFEQQRSDLWERLYVETKDERAKGDTEPKVKKTKERMSQRVKETFDAVKNSTKEFVHHHKEQIKKAKEAVKENLRKFSDSVKSTFRHFKDSASTFINKARGYYKKRSDENPTKESRQHGSHKPHHRHKPDSFHGGHNTRKSGEKVHEEKERGQNSHKANTKGCSGVFECAYLESMSLFNVGMEPIRAKDFYQLLQNYLQQEVHHFHHWKDLEMFLNSFFHNGLFIHDQMLFTDFVSGVENYLADMHEYHSLDDDVFGDLDDYIYTHYFGEAYTKSYGPSGPFEKPDSKESSRAKNHQRKQQGARSRSHSERKWSRSGRNSDRHMADVKIELGPMPFDPKY